MQMSFFRFYIKRRRLICVWGIKGVKRLVSLCAGAQGNFDLLVMLPVMARNLLESITLIGNVSRVLATRCVDGIEANVERCRQLAESSPSIVTPLNRIVGYEAAAKIAKRAYAEKRPVLEVALEDSGLDEKTLRRLLDPAALTRGGIASG